MQRLDVVDLDGDASVSHPSGVALHDLILGTIEEVPVPPVDQVLLHEVLEAEEHHLVDVIDS